MFLGSLGVVPIHLSPICGVSYSYVMSVSISFVLFELPTSSVRRWPDCCNSCWFHLQIEAKKDPEVKHLHRWTTPLNTATWHLPMISMIVYDSLWSKKSKSTFLANAFDEPCRLWHLMALATRFRGTPSDVQRTGGGLESKGAEGTWLAWLAMGGFKDIELRSPEVFWTRCCWFFEESLRGWICRTRTLLFSDPSAILQGFVWYFVVSHGIPTSMAFFL